LLARPPAQRLNREIMRAYLGSQPSSCGGVTLGVYVYHLRLVLRYICPRHDWSWLSTISRRVAAQAKRKPERHHLITSETLFALGIELMDNAIVSSAAKKTVTASDEVAYRNG